MSCGAPPKYSNAWMCPWHLLLCLRPKRRTEAKAAGTESGDKQMRMPHSPVAGSATGILVPAKSENIFLSSSVHLAHAETVICLLSAVMRTECRVLIAIRMFFEVLVPERGQINSWLLQLVVNPDEVRLCSHQHVSGLCRRKQKRCVDELADGRSVLTVFSFCFHKLQVVASIIWLGTGSGSA